MRLTELNKELNRINSGLRSGTIRRPRPEVVAKLNSTISRLQHGGIGLVKVGGGTPVVSNAELKDKVGILDPEGVADNPLTGEPYKNLYADLPAKNKPGTYVDFAKIWTGLPVYPKAEEIIKDIADNRVMIFTAGTGSGKTVLIPKFALHTYGYKGKIAVTNPKKIPTKNAAIFAAKTLDVAVGGEVGYAFRGENEQSGRTRLLYCTDGLLATRMAGSDPNLEEFDMVIIDEAHERNVQIDLLLAQLKALLMRRDDFKVIIMSATIDPTSFQKYFTVAGIKPLVKNIYDATNFPVEEVFYPKTPINQFNPDGTLKSGPYVEKAVEVIIEEIVKPGKEGNILVFLTGVKESQDACRMLMDQLRKLPADTPGANVFCTVLHGSSSKEDEKLGTSNAYSREGMVPGGPYERLVVMATEAVESSITFDTPIVFIVDSGLSKSDRYYPAYRMNALELRYISKASHKQRKGRTGRVGPGFCYNLFTKKEYEEMRDYTDPPILTSDLTPEIVRFMGAEFVSHATLPFEYPKEREILKVKGLSLNELLGGMITPPDVASIKTSLKLLHALGALGVEADEPSEPSEPDEPEEPSEPDEPDEPEANTSEPEPESEKKTMGGGKEQYVVLNQVGEVVRMLHNMHPISSRAIIAAYKYNVRDEVIGICAVLEVIQDRLDALFPQFRSKFKPEDDRYRSEKIEFDKGRGKWETSAGDHFMINKVFQAYRDKESALFDKFKITAAPEPEEPSVEEGDKFIPENLEDAGADERAGELAQELNKALNQSAIAAEEMTGGEPEDEGAEGSEDTDKAITSKSGQRKAVERELRKWCKDNTVSYKILDKASRIFRDTRGQFGRAVKRYPDVFRLDAAPETSNKKETNILRALFDGYFANLASKDGHGSNYLTCFESVDPKAPEIPAGIDRSSVLRTKKGKPGEFVFYASFRKILGRPVLGVVSNVPKTRISELDKLQKDYVKKCTGAERKSSQKDSGSRKGNGKRRGKGDRRKKRVKRRR